MRKAYLLFLCLCLGLFCSAQHDPVHWKFKTNKIGDRLYEIHFSASVDMPWHIYSQNNNENFTQPTTFNFDKNALVEIVGKAKESGTLETDSISGTMLKYYEDQVDFIQTVRLKYAVKTTITGKLTYMACTGGRCLSPVEHAFSIAIGNN